MAKKNLLQKLHYSNTLEHVSKRYWNFALSFFLHLQSGTADAEIKVPSAENPQLTNALLLKIQTQKSSKERLFIVAVIPVSDFPPFF